MKTIYRHKKQLDFSQYIRRSAQEQDFKELINVRKAGYDVIRLNRYGIDLGIPVGEGTGGIQDFDRALKMEQEMKDIKALYPGIVFRYKPERSWKYEIDFTKSKF